MLHTNFVALLVALICAMHHRAGSQSVIPWPAKETFMMQTVDHFTFGPQKQVFKQKILYEDKWWDKDTGAIFFYCGNEGPIEAFWNNTGFMFEAAQEFRALVVFGEHRYYGSSLPFGPNQSFQQPFIQYLSVEQALADYAYMISAVRAAFIAPDRPVIAFGGSYGGMLAAYMRFKYPNLVLGSLAASAPLNWVAGLGTFHQFFEVITEDCRSYDERCPQVLKGGFIDVIFMGKQGTQGWQKLSQIFSLCEPLQSADDVDHLLRWARNAFVMMAMMDYPYESSFMSHLPANPINKSCDAAMKYGGLFGLREAAAILYNDSTLTCFDIKQQYIQCADITGCGLGPDSLAWDFQACTEIALYDDGQPTSKDMFPYLPQRKADVDAYCRAKWNATRAERQMDLLMWGGDVRAASNIIFSNGNLDPWSLGGILKNVTDTVVAFLVQGGAHHLDLRESNAKDPESVKIIRQAERDTIRQWLNATSSGRSR